MNIGVIATKLGMSSIFFEDGYRCPVTLLLVLPGKVLSIKTKKSHGYDSVLVGVSKVKDSKLSKPMSGFYKSHKSDGFLILKEFRVNPNSILPKVGDMVDGSIFSSGFLVDVKGVTIGKGFAGAMKRHNFGGLEATHGVSVSHRSHGSTGGCQDPGKVFKNKKMAGHMGFTSCSIQNLEVVSYDSASNILAVRGSVPGSRGSQLSVTHSIKKVANIDLGV